MQKSAHRDEQRPERDHGPGREVAIRARGLSKLYRNPWTLKVISGIEPLDLDVARGEVIGLLGPNGAGKTTTLKLLTGLIKPTAGHAWLLGESFDRPESRRLLGFLPEQPYFYDYLNGIEYLELAAGLSGLQAADSSRRAKHWLGRVGLGDRPRLVLRKYSKGMLQRLGLAAALVHDPELVILDEPMSGLDPFGRRDVRELIVEQRERGVTVLFSSHILPDVEMLCDRVAIVLKGKLTRVATVAELTQVESHPVAIRFAGHPVIEIPATLADDVERREHRGETEFMVRDGSRLDEVLDWARRSGLRVLAVTPQRQTLEELFMATARSEHVEPAERVSRSA
jgi:ABC-2 type transport system ATP-binding protein